jgi:hypothetical protein
MGTMMKTKRVSHSVCEVMGGRFVYAFGGQDENLKGLKTIERVSFGDDLNPEASMSAWEVIELQMS